ncbi:MAG: YtxH domain-containing protein [Candidatus Electronema sp. V4]|uniref:YtxH domain-containing protein n=1 Tax=Candidatus Electronema sp. V4 TaxID=3454756 RepID=UPI00405562CA
MSEYEKHPSHFAMFFLMGGALGALAGILLAPKSGRRLRADLRSKGSDAVDDTKEMYADVSARAKDIIEDAEHQAEVLKQEAERYLAEARKKVKALFACGEAR